MKVLHFNSGKGKQCVSLYHKSEWLLSMKDIVMPNSKGYLPMWIYDLPQTVWGGGKARWPLGRGALGVFLPRLGIYNFEIT